MWNQLEIHTQAAPGRKWEVFVSGGDSADRGQEGTGCTAYLGFHFGTQVQELEHTHCPGLCRMLSRSCTPLVASGSTAGIESRPAAKLYTYSTSTNKALLKKLEIHFQNKALIFKTVNICRDFKRRNDLKKIGNCWTTHEYKLNL